MSKVSTTKPPKMLLPTVAEDKAITAAAKADPEAQPLTPKQLQALLPLKALRRRPKPESRS